MRALMTATVPSMIGKFNMENIKLLQSMGYEVDVACDFKDRSAWDDERVHKFISDLTNLNIKTFQIDFTRSITKVNCHIKSFKQLKELMNTREYNLIHTHTPISSFVTRVAYRYSDIYITCKMIYTAHGFHFFKGNSSIKNIVFKSIEKYAARYTDILITINKEDYYAAKKFNLKQNGQVRYIPGVGINTTEIDLIPVDKEKLFSELKIPDTSILLLSVGELNENKNHQFVIRVLSRLPDNVHYLICGQGHLGEELMRMSNEVKVSDRVHLLGYQDNVLEIMKSCDYFVFPSKREGLSVALMEAIACDLICIASDIRGNSDLISDGTNGFLIDCNSNTDKCVKLFSNLFKKNIDYEEYKNNSKILIKNFDIRKIEKEMLLVYRGE